MSARGGEVALRDATAADCARVWAWRFAEDVRAVSVDPRVVELDAHAAWYAARLAKRGSPLWIVEDAGAGVGVVRIDRLPDEGGLISIALAKAARGRGVGRAAITAACRQWNGRVIAIIRVDNTASRAAFEACGFAELERAPLDLITYLWSPDAAA